MRSRASFARQAPSSIPSERVGPVPYGTEHGRILAFVLVTMQTAHLAPSARQQVNYPLRNFMHPSPHSVGRKQTLAFAHEQMRAHRLRHLPVLDGGKLTGILSQRDAYFVETLRDVDPAKVSVEDAMSSDVYTASPDTPLLEVSKTMAERKYGCVGGAEGRRE